MKETSKRVLNAGYRGRAAPCHRAARPVPWTMVEWINRAGTAVPKQRRCSRIVFIDLIGSRKAPIFFGTPCQNIEKSGLWDGSRGDVPARRVGTLRLSPGVPTPDPDPHGHQKGSGGAAPRLPARPAIVPPTSRNNMPPRPIKGAVAEQRAIRNGSRVGSRVGTCTAVHPTPADPDFYICGI